MAMSALSNSFLLLQQQIPNSSSSSSSLPPPTQAHHHHHHHHHRNHSSSSNHNFRFTNRPYFSGVRARGGALSPSTILHLPSQINRRRRRSSLNPCAAALVDPPPPITTTTTTATHLQQQQTSIVGHRSVSVILLAGGKGKRMGASMPKQYLPLLGQPIALYSFFTFSDMAEVKEIVVVCDPSYQDIFKERAEKIQVDLKFTTPGKERQDSVYSGLQAIDPHSQLVCIHDSARPLVTPKDIEQVLRDGWVNGAAVLGVPVKATIKEANGASFVTKTLDRRTLWEMQTPQVIKPELLQKGFELVNREHLEVTDDVSIVEHLNHPVYITEGSYTNIKVTTPDDLLLAERLLSRVLEGSPSIL